jgi:hypothetical protein
LDYRLVASPRATALRSFLVCLSAGALLNCAKAAPNSTGSGGSKGSGGSSASGGSNGSGGSNSSGGNNGSGGSSSSGGNGSGGSVSSGGNTGSGGSSSSGSGGNTNSGGATGSGGVSGSGGASGSTGSGGAGGDVMVGDAGTDAVCQTADLTWAPQIPSVFVLVDQSGSEFSTTPAPFSTLRTAVLNVVNSLQSQVRFGVGVFTGDYQDSPVRCPIWNTVAPDINNYAKINTLYSAQSQPQFKAETPAVMVLPLVQKALASDTGTGAKYILFATDSETDFCDDGAPDCPVDAVTYQLQTLYSGTPSIGTKVIGLPATGDNLATEALQNYANAGAGLPVVFPTASGIQTQNQLYSQCKTRGGNAGQYSWPNLYAATGKPATDADGAAIASYGTAGGNATVFTPASTSETDLEKQISAAINGVKACSFDLSNVGGKSIKVDLTKLSQATIQIEGKTIAQDATNGWSMSSSTTLVLNGTACTTWRMPNVSQIHFGFPCSTIIFE